MISLVDAVRGSAGWRYVPVELHMLATEVGEARLREIRREAANDLSGLHIEKKSCREPELGRWLKTEIGRLTRTEKAVTMVLKREAENPGAHREWPEELAEDLLYCQRILVGELR